MQNKSEIHACVAKNVRDAAAPGSARVNGGRVENQEITQELNVTAQRCLKDVVFVKVICGSGPIPTLSYAFGCSSLQKCKEKQELKAG